MPFTQKQLEDAYAQMQQERAADLSFAQLAADKLGAAVGLPGKFQPQVPQMWSNAAFMAATAFGGVTPWPTDYILVISLCEYDDWTGTIAALQAAGVQMKPWSGTSYNPPPEGEYDVSGDPAFAASAKQKYTVGIQYYNAHEGGV